MRLRPSSSAVAILLALCASFAACLVDAAWQRGRREAEVAAMRALTVRLGLTDLALFTEARYTRHPSQADLHSAFQDHPLALEHFPSGSLIVPRYDNMDRKAAAPD